MQDIQRQTDAPLFPDIFWNRPTIKSRGGRLLVVGGHKHEFVLVQNIYQIAEAAGAGYVQAAMPDTLRALIGGSEFGYFLPATASGSLGRAATGELLHLAEDYDGLVIGGNLTNNSETGILVESLVTRSERPVIITEEAIEILKFNPNLITGNPHAIVVATMPGLFALANNHHIPLAIKPNRGVMGKIEILQQLVDISRSSYMVFDQEVIVASEGKISLTPLKQPLSNDSAIPVGVAATMWIQNRSKPFEALSTAAFIASQASHADPLTITNAAKVIRQTFLQYEEQ